MDSFAGKIAIVTGGGSGMGRELVRQLAAEGCSVATCDLNADYARRDHGAGVGRGRWDRSDYRSCVRCVG